MTSDRVANSFTGDIALIKGIPAVPSILEVLCRTTGMGFAAIARVTENRWIACSVLDQISFGLEAGGELVVESTICHEIRQSRQAVVIDHVAEDEVYRNHHTPRQYGFQSYISMPILLSDGQFFGTLCSIDPKPARLNKPEIIAMFKLFAELISFHIEAAQKVAISETKLLREHEVSELREQFIGVLGHDLRTPLGAISMGATLLRKTGLNEMQGKAVAFMEESVGRMAELIEDTLDFTRGRLGGGISLESRSDHSVEAVLKQVIDEALIRWPSREIETHYSMSEPVHLDRRRITQLFSNLLTNAMTHGKPESAVKVRAKSSNGIFELSVANAAEPIPASVLQRIFEPYSRGNSKDFKEGLGLGLYIASQIAKAHEGTLTAVSNEQETRFTFIMPAACKASPDTGKIEKALTDAA